MSLAPPAPSPLEEPEELAPAAAAPPALPDVDGRRCKNCSAPMKASAAGVCMHCGYYELLDRVVELDPWERDGGAAPAPEKPKSHLEVWLKLIPVWGWILAGCILAVVGLSVAAHLLLPAQGSARTIWALSQLGLGFTAMAGMHVFVYVCCLMDSDCFNLLDIFLRPFAIWTPTVKKLPETTAKVAIAACGLVLMILAVALIGGIPYERLWDWGIKPAPKRNLMAAIVDQAKKMAKDEAESLEDAVGKLTEDEEKKKEPEKPKPVEVECLIVGYTTAVDDPTRVTSLLLAGSVKRQLRLTGSVSMGLTAEIQAKLLEKFKLIGRETPFLASKREANWVEPTLTCRVLCAKVLDDGNLVEPAFDGLLAEIDLKQLKRAK